MTSKNTTATEAPRPITVTVKHAAQITGLGISTIWRLIADDKLETTSYGRRRLVKFDSLEKLVLGKAA